MYTYTYKFIKTKSTNRFNSLIFACTLYKAHRSADCFGLINSWCYEPQIVSSNRNQSSGSQSAYTFESRQVLHTANIMLSNSLRRLFSSVTTFRENAMNETGFKASGRLDRFKHNTEYHICGERLSVNERVYFENGRS
ncbi:unnamed protein product [Ceratitis capitata]|uniref:(Mediterranean fruit fly) hypothetical protein n=1 Tax=Ceratitis capitata TaxID=7213 RepID=A0A811VBB2_CERCA|nr:unnamed protein product [Ceratitis capitata]